ncbi:MAG TPA: mechanosensitive ion channel family protein [Terriglobales bacterium]|nr:mechanosensitive ion channel family protein [Terriglobales bacterium]
MNYNITPQVVIETLTRLGLKVLGAIALFIVGRWLIKLALALTTKALNRQQLDPTIVRYISSALGVILNVVLIVALLGFFGVETTTFAALLAGVGIAIGAAWSGLLANFAAGVFLVLLRPFKVGDFVSAGGVTGTIQSIGMFGTTMNAPDNVQTIVGNNKILSDNIQNYSTNAFRRVDLLAQIAHGVDHREAINLLKSGMARIPNVLGQPAPDVEILQFTPAGPVLAVRPYCSNEHYWQVYFDTNRLIRESFTAAGYPVPEQHYAVRGGMESSARSISSTAA